ncbi:MmgE/PrpD family protein [Xanthobacter sp. V4C-4]|uniref:MmgE/PrpD family protein n=1 Tax=Xanthobacter cornucopiae TaxID=3119924 RepID=UPI003728001D
MYISVKRTPPALPRTDVTAAMVEVAAGIGYAQLPAEVVASVKRSLLDTLAVAWAARDAAGVPAARALALRGGPGHASLWTHRATRREPAIAAFFNGTLAAALDFDSLCGQIHADATVVPAALAMAEQQRRSGRELITALALGTELAIRLAAAGTTRKGWFPTSIAGVFGAALAAARLIDLDPRRTHNALGIALCQAGGTHQSHLEHSLTARLQAAFAARDGVTSAELAALGITGPQAAFEGPYGLFALFEQGAAEVALAGFGTDFHLTATTLRRFPACASSQAALQAATDIVTTHALTADAVARGEIVLSAEMARLVGGPFAPTAGAKGVNQTPPQLAAQFNVRYGVATILLRGGFELGDLAPAAVLDPRVANVVERLSVRVDETRSGPLAPADVALETHDGRRFHARVESLPGSADAPLPEAERYAKLIDGFSSGSAALPERRIEALIQRIERLEGVDDLSTLFEQLH